jgi:16S rRNA U1498 N3-methylase RsmE
LLDAARAEQKWWKPLVKLNKEQKVLDEAAEAERRNQPPRVSAF